MVRSSRCPGDGWRVLAGQMSSGGFPEEAAAVPASFSQSRQSQAQAEVERARARGAREKERERDVCIRTQSSPHSSEVALPFPVKTDSCMLTQLEEGCPYRSAQPLSITPMGKDTQDNWSRVSSRKNREEFPSACN